MRVQVATVYIASFAIKTFADSTDWPKGTAVFHATQCPALYATQLGVQVRVIVLFSVAKYVH